MTQRIIILFIFFICFNSCKKDFFPSHGPGLLTFSNDTVIFDTIFTSIGSITKTLKVYNNNDNDIIISSINIAKNNGVYKINVDGISASEAEDISIPANDSIYVFVEARIDPVEGDLPYLVTDSLIFTTNGTRQDVDLVAYGQNAHFHTPNTNITLNIGTETINFQYHSINAENIEAWNNDLPHVVYGYVIIENTTLNINPGTKIHFHKNSGIIVGNPFIKNESGTLKVNGEINNEVIFQGDRLEQWWDNAAGQWDRIWFSPGSINNEIEYAIIRNGTVGLHADSIGNSTYPTLTVKNSIIQNMSDIGIFAQGSYIKGINNVITNCGRYTLVLNIGGDYRFDHCTFANYWFQSSRNTPSILLNNYYEDINNNIQARDLDNAEFINCIITGSLPAEIKLEKTTNANFNYNFNHCLLKIHPDSTVLNLEQINSIKINNNDPSIFFDSSNDNYELSESSQAIDAGIITIETKDDFDILKQPRDDGFPDIGAYEKIK